MYVKPRILILVMVVPGCSRDAPAVKNASRQPPEESMGMPLILAEEFDEPSPDRWMPTDPAAWKFTKDGDRSVYAMVARSDYKPKYRSPEGISVLKDLYVSDFVLDVWLCSTAKDYAHRDMCVFFGHQGPTRFYYVHFGLKSDEVSNTIHIVNDKPRAPIAETRTEGTPWTEGYHQVRVVRKVESGTIEAYFDDMTTPAMTAHDTTLQWGRIGVGSFDDTGNVDRIVLWGRRTTPPASNRPAGAGEASRRSTTQSSADPSR